MPQNLTETPAPGGTVVAPVTGDPVTDASIIQGLQPLVNRVRYLEESQGIGETAIEFQQPLAGMIATDFAQSAPSGGDISPVQSDTTIPFALWECPHVPLTGVLVGAQIVIDPSGGHGGLPANMPTLGLYRREMGGGSAALLGSQVDTSASVGAYEAEHLIEITGLSEDADDPHAMYVISFGGESGANSIANMQVIAIALVFDLTGQSV